MGEPITITVSEQGNIMSVNWQEWILNELTLPVTRDDVAKTYSYIIQTQPERHWDISKINKAIMARWSKSALIYIKEKAWKMASGSED